MERFNDLNPNAISVRELSEQYVAGKESLQTFTRALSQKAIEAAAFGCGLGAVVDELAVDYGALREAAISDGRADTAISVINGITLACEGQLARTRS